MDPRFALATYAILLQGLLYYTLGSRPNISDMKQTSYKALAGEPVPSTEGSNSLNFNVMDYGAVGDGETDDSQAFLKAWGDACKAVGGVPVFQVPGEMTFLLKPTGFGGPCKSPNIQMEIKGNIVAPKALEDWTGCQADSWLLFSDIGGLTIFGDGQFDGQGSLWWTNASPEGSSTCKRPTALRFRSCQDLRVQGITSLNSPKNHISINECQTTDLSHIHLIAPEDSPNTDGVDISKSSDVQIHSSTIATGDDCVAINGGSSLINITDVSCGPGHGISVGSLGANGARETVEHVLVKNCTFSGTLNGARIKTWEGGSGYAKNITFEEIILDKAKNPIIIDQHYCNGRHDCPNATSAVEISDVIYRDFQGTTVSKIAISLDCSYQLGCQNLEFDNVKITSATDEEPQVYCQNAKGTIVSSTPNVPCLSGS